MRILPCLLIAATLAQGQAPDESFFRGDPLKVARFCAEKALARDAKNLEYLAALGDILSAGGDRPGAEAQYAKMASLRPRDRETYLLIGRSYLRYAKDRKKAEEAFAKAEVIAPASVENCQEITKAWLAFGDREAAFAEVPKAKERAARDPERTAEFATLLMDSGFPEEAAQIMDLAFKAKVKDFDALKDYACACLRARRPQEGVAWMDRALTAKVRDLKAYREAAMAFADHGAPEDLQVFKARMLEIAEIGFAERGLDNDDLANRAWIHLACGERDQAEALYRKIVLSKKVEAATLRLIGRAYLRLGLEEEAFRAYGLLADAQGSGQVVGVGHIDDPSRPFTRPGASAFGVMVYIDIPKITKKNALAESALDLASKGHLDRALPLMSEAYLLDAEDFDWAIQFAQACLKGGQRDQAIAYFAKAAKGGVKEKECWASLAQAFLDLGLSTPPSGVGSPR